MLLLRGVLRTPNTKARLKALEHVRTTWFVYYGGVCNLCYMPRNRAEVMF